MTESVVLDSSIIIAIENRRLSSDQVFTSDVRPILASIVFSEVLVGIHLDTNSKRKSQKQESLDQIKGLCKFKDLGEKEAEHLAELLAHTNKVGKKRGKYDLIIAAIARANDATIITHDRKAKFEGLPGVKVREI